MIKPYLTKQAFVDEINGRISAHASSKPGMVAKFYPEGASAETATGVMYEGPEELRERFVAIEAEVRQHFEVEGAPRAEER